LVGQPEVIRFIRFAVGLVYPSDHFQVGQLPLGFSVAACRTVLLPGRSNVTVVFDANNPGIWHLAAGMATLVLYDV
jgi:hypothetical protein